MEKVQVKKTELRKPIYKLFESLIGREMTPNEHVELKTHILAYAGGERDENAKLRFALANQAKRMDHLRALFGNLKGKVLVKDEKLDAIIKSLIPIKLELK